jgi:hypothetical protein
MSRCIDAGQGLDSSYQHRVRYIERRRDHIQAMPDAIDQVDISMARRTKHDLGPRSATARRMRRQILRPAVRLGFNDPRNVGVPSTGVHQVQPDQLPGHCQCFACIESARQLCIGQDDPAREDERPLTLPACHLQRFLRNAIKDAAQGSKTQRKAPAVKNSGVYP